MVGSEGNMRSMAEISSGGTNSCTNGKHCVTWTGWTTSGIAVVSRGLTKMPGGMITDAATATQGVHIHESRQPSARRSCCTIPNE